MMLFVYIVAAVTSLGLYQSTGVGYWLAGTLFFTVVSLAEAGDL